MPSACHRCSQASGLTEAGDTGWGWGTDKDGGGVGGEDRGTGGMGDGGRGWDTTIWQPNPSYSEATAARNYQKENTDSQTEPGH